MSAPLGMENGSIPDTSIIASSVFDSLNPAHYVRLGLAASKYWINAYADTAPWIQVNLGCNYRLTALQTKGNYISASETSSAWVWVEIIEVEFMTSNGTLAFVADSDGQPRVFFKFFA